MDCVVIYGAVNTAKLKSGLALYGSVQPMDMAFRLCVTKTEEWFKVNAPDDFGLLISDDTTNNKHKDAIQNAFRMLRPKAKFSATNNRKGLLEHFHDDMYFGDSKYCVGIQMADMCSYLIMRHLDGCEDTELIYGLLKSQISLHGIEPC